MILLALLCQVFSSTAVAQKDQLISSRLDPIRFQLRWHHQFQFAGYYAAKEKGFYEQAGFDVTLVAGSPDVEPVEEVLAGRAQYAEGNSEVLYARLMGEPLVAMAVIFQHSPSVLLTLQSSGIKTPSDLINKRVMSVGGQSDAVFLAMLNKEGVALDQVGMVASTYQIEDLINGRADAFNSYATNEPFYLEERGVPYNIIAPRDYGVDFYSDILFTSEQEVKNNPERVRRFKEATLLGWKYALANPEEIIQLIRGKYNNKKTLNHMRFEAISIQSLIMPDLVEVGYINPQRFEAMADVFLQQKMIDSTDALKGFIFEDEEEISSEVYSLLIAVCVFLVAALLVALVLALFNHRLQNEIQERKTIEAKLTQLAETDDLTQLLNRRAFTRRYNEELVRAQRYGDTFSVLLLDLDLFKRVNDRYGHEAGDRVLKSVASMLQEDTRESDICGRFGGEEFILLLPKTPLAEAVVYAERLCQHFRQYPISLRDDKSVTITASIGVVEWSKDDVDETTILKADKALYSAKSAGRDQVAIYNDSLNE